MKTRKEMIQQGIDDNDITTYEEDQLETLYEVEMRGTYGDIDVCGMVMDAVTVLKEMDNIAYREGFNNWLDAESDHFEEFSVPGDTFWIDRQEAEAYLEDHSEEWEG